MGSFHMCLTLFTPLIGFTVQRLKILAPELSLGSWSLGVAHNLSFWSVTSVEMHLNEECHSLEDVIRTPIITWV